MANGQAVGQKRQAEAQTLTPDQMGVAKKWLQLVAQARADKTLKQRLMDTPVAVLQEHGINVRQGVDIRVVENTEKVGYLMLPAAGSESLGSSELTNEQLDSVFGGGAVSVAASSLSLFSVLENAVNFMVNCKINDRPCTPP